MGARGRLPRSIVAVLFLLVSHHPALLRGARAAPEAASGFVLFLTDDQRFDTVPYMPIVSAKLAKKGMTLRRAYVVNPLCCPSRASTLTGSYSHSTGVYGNDAVAGFGAFDDASTIATWLDAAGYGTAYIGKYLNGYSDATYVPPGWDRWFVFTGGGNKYFDYTMSDDGIERSYGTDPEDYSTDVLAEQAESFIRGLQPEHPFFLVVAPHAPHVPATPAPRHADSFGELDPWRPRSFNERQVADKPRYIRRLPRLDDDARRRIDRARIRQLGSLLAVDEAVGRIIRTLADLDRLETTMLVYTSDNGYLWGEHRWRGKRVPYEESIRVPFVLRYDAWNMADRDGTALGIDLAPTLAEVAGVETPPVDGRSLVPLLRGEPWERGTFLIEYSAARPPPAYCAVHAPRSVYVRLATGEEELYRLRRDPLQLKNDAGRPSGLRARMRHRVDELCAPPPPGF